MIQHAEVVVRPTLSYHAERWNSAVKGVIAQHSAHQQADLAEYWLDATARLMAAPNPVYCHYLQDQQGNLVVALPLIHQQTRFALRLTALTSFYSSLSTLYGTAKPADVSLLLREIMAHWQCSSIQLGPLPAQSELQQALASPLADFSFICYQRFINYYQQVDTDYATYLLQRPTSLQQTIKRKQKKISALGGQVYVCRSEADIRQHLPDFHQVYQHSWKQAEYHTGFIDDVCLAAARCDEVRLGLVEVNQQVIAAQLWFVRGSVASIFKLAYHRQYQHLSAGTVLSAAMFSQVIEQDNVSCIEYGMGDEPYKADWMSDKRNRVGILLFNLNRFGGWCSWCRHKLPTLWRRE